jgi:PLP dependent protein
VSEPGTIAERLAAVRARVQAAAERAGRAPESVRLLAVSKTKSEAEIREAYAAGQRAFGENYAQELAKKAEALADLPGIEWHMIGPLQRNKVRLVTGVVALMHTVDRVDLAADLDRRAAAAGRVLPVLLEINVSGERSKAGVAGPLARFLAGEVRAMSHLRLVGLMTIPPDTEDRELARPYFAELRRLRDKLGGNLPELSMGMSHDFEIAIEEGATIVRVGTAIFGSRS